LSRTHQVLGVLVLRFTVDLIEGTMDACDLYCSAEWGSSAYDSNFVSKNNILIYRGTYIDPALNISLNRCLFGILEQVIGLPCPKEKILLDVTPWEDSA
jgi:hypothetical protein